MKKSSYYMITLLSAFMLMANQAEAQWHKWHIGGGVGSLTYYGDLSDKFVNANLQELGYHGYVERLLTKRNGIYLRLESVNGHLQGSDRAKKGWVNGESKYFDRSLNFRTKFHDVNTSFVFYLVSYKKRDREPFINAYIRAGIGVGYFDVYGDLKDADGNFYHYWSDRTIRNIAENDVNSSQAEVISRDGKYETNLRKLEVEKSYNRFKWQIPVGLGIKMRMGDVVSLILDAQYTYAMTDYFDNVGDKKIRTDLTSAEALYAADPAGFIGDNYRNIDKKVGFNDSYLYVSAGLNFNLGKNQKPRFKSPTFYPNNLPAVEIEEEEVTIVEEEVVVEEGEVLVEETEIVVEEIEVVEEAEEVAEVEEEDLVEIEEELELERDSAFAAVFQETHEQLFEQDTLTNYELVDSIALDKLDQGQYVVQYFSNIYENDVLDTTLLVKVDTLQFDLETQTISREAIDYPSSETIAEMDSLPEMVVIDSIELELEVDSLVLKEEIIPEDTLQLEVVEIDSIVVDSIDTTLQAIEVEEVIEVDSIPSLEEEVDSLIVPIDTVIEGIKDSLDVVIDSLKTAQDDIQVEEIDALIDEIQIDSLSQVVPTDSIYDVAILELTQRIDELEKLQQERLDSLMQARENIVDSVVVQRDTIVQMIEPDSLSELEMQELQNRIEELERVLEERNLESIKDTLFQKDVEAKLLPHAGQSTIDSLQEVKIQELKNRLKGLGEGEYVAPETKLQEEQSKAKEKLEEQENEAQKRIQELNEQILRAKDSHDSLAKLKDPSEKLNSLENKAQEKKILQLEAEVKSLEKQLLEAQYKRDEYDYARKVIDEYPTQKLTQAEESSHDLAKKMEDKKNEQAKKTPRMSFGFNYNNQPGYTSDTKEQKELEELKKKAEELVVDSIKVDSNAVDSLGVEIQPIERKEEVVEKTDTEILSKIEAQLAKENQVLKEQIGSIEKSQDSLLNILQTILTKMDQPVEAPKVTEPIKAEKPDAQEIERQRAREYQNLLQTIVSQPSTKIFFGVGKSTFDNQYKNGLDILANQLKSHAELRVELKGFADPTGNAASNLKLSEARAQSVRNYLESVHNIAPTRISVLPVGQENNSQNLSYSRRVEVQLIK